MAGATAAVMLSLATRTLSALLLLQRGGALRPALSAMALHRGDSGLLRRGTAAATGDRDTIGTICEREKALVLRSIKELEFDHAMGKVSEADFADISPRLRARALDVMADLDRAPCAAPVSDSPRRPRPSTTSGTGLAPTARLLRGVSAP